MVRVRVRISDYKAQTQGLLSSISDQPIIITTIPVAKSQECEGRTVRVPSAIPAMTNAMFESAFAGVRRKSPSLCVWPTTIRNQGIHKRWLGFDYLAIFVLGRWEMGGGEGAGELETRSPVLSWPHTSSCQAPPTGQDLLLHAAPIAILATVRVMVDATIATVV